MRTAVGLMFLPSAMPSFGQIQANPVIGNEGSQRIYMPGNWVRLSRTPTDAQGELKITLNGAGADLYVRKGAAPTTTQYDYKVTGSASVKTITVTNASSVPLTSSVWYAGAVATKPTGIGLSAAVNKVKTSFNIKGAVPFTGGCSFKIWAPNASAAWVAGEFNSWSATSLPLVSEGNGWWSTDIRNIAAGKQYKFILKNGTNTFWKNDPWARRMVSSTGNSYVYNPNGYAWQTNNFQTPTWDDLVLYEMHIGSFNDTAGGSPGTFLSAINKLDHLQSLGINAVEVMPVMEYPTDFSWGYNLSFPFAVESAYGGPDNFKKFIDEANKRGIAVILDVIHNHWGPSDLDLWRYDGWYSGSYGGIFFYNDGRATTPWGDRPNYGRDEVRQYIRDNQMQWLSEFRCSGLRWDSTVNMRTTNLGDNPEGKTLLQALNNDKNASFPYKINIAEDLQNYSWVTQPTSSGGAGFDTQWSNFVHTVRGALTPSDDNSRNMNSVRDAITEKFNNDAFQRVIYTENHDEDANGKQRLPSEIDSATPGSYWAQKRSTLGAALVMTSPGIPMLFQGQEILEDGWFADTDPVDWTKATTYAGIKQLYTDLISLRRNLTNRTLGLKGQNVNAFHVNNTNKMLAFHRWKNGGTNDDVIVVANFKNTTWTNYRIGFPRSGSWSVVFNSDWNGYSSLFGNTNCPNVNATTPAADGLNFSGTVTIAPYSVVIFAKD